MYIAALVFEFYNYSILTNKIHCTYHEMQAANETNKNERGMGYNLASLNCAFLSRACKYELQVIFYFEAALLHFSIYTLSDLGVLSNLIGSLSLANEHYSPPTE